MTVRTGICRNGPLNGKVHTERESRAFSPDMTGTYYWRPASGPTPSQWLWIARKENGE